MPRSILENCTDINTEVIGEGENALFELCSYIEKKYKMEEVSIGLILLTPSCSLKRVFSV